MMTTGMYGALSSPRKENNIKTLTSSLKKKILRRRLKQNTTPSHSLSLSIYIYIYIIYYSFGKTNQLALTLCRQGFEWLDCIL